MREHTASDAKPDARRSTVLAAVFACLWGAALFASILTAGLRLWPALSGRLVLGLIAVGFVFFTVARASNPEAAGSARLCARLLSPRMRAVYWAGYALMACGVALTAAVSLKLW